jgi:hypothetical protein
MLLYSFLSSMPVSRKTGLPLTTRTGTFLLSGRYLHSAHVNKLAILVLKAVCGRKSEKTLCLEDAK